MYLYNIIYVCVCVCIHRFVNIIGIQRLDPLVTKHFFPLFLCVYAGNYGNVEMQAGMKD